MLFNSYEFIFAFLPIVFIIYFYLNSNRLVTASKTWLVISSLFFYSWWNIVYLPLILISILFNYALANSMQESNENLEKYFSKKTLLRVGLVFNIGLLGYFKYMDFFIENINFLSNSNIDLLNLALPLAISFFTLQQIAFIIDSYEGLVKEKDFLNYCLFVTFFPQLIAGPIVHHKEMMPQFESLRTKVKNYKNIAMGTFIFSIGLFKKVVIADTFAIWVNEGFDVAETLNFFEAWAVSLSYTFQIYFDFSGYIDMAIGAALLFNIKLPINFNSPYVATSIIDFWARWHITLTNFITTYVYTPVLRSYKRITFEKAMIATVIAFIISGIWHGASWMFILWGLLHGIALVVNHYWRKKVKIKINKILAWVITFNFVNIANLIFRAKEWDDAVKILKGMFILPNDIDTINSLISFANINKIDLLLIVLVFIFAIITLFMKNSIQLLDSFKHNNKNLFIIVFAFVISVLHLSKISVFLYFNF